MTPPAKQGPRTWRYGIDDDSGWLATVFLDEEGTLAVHSSFGSASIRWQVAGGDPRVAIASQGEEENLPLGKRLAETSMRPRGTMDQIVRTVFPRLRRALREELVAEHGVQRFAEVVAKLKGAP